MSLRLRKRRSIWYAKGAVYAGQYRIDVPEFSTHCRDKSEAEAIARQVEGEKLLAHMRTARAAQLADEAFRLNGKSDALPPWATSLWLQARKRAAISGIVFDLGEADMAYLVARANGACEVSGISFNLDRPQLAYRRPFAPSLDRVDSSAAYVAANCRLVCCAVNFALGEWGERVLLAIAKGIVAKRRLRRPAAVLPRSTSATCPNQSSAVRVVEKATEITD